MTATVSRPPWMVAIDRAELDDEDFGETVNAQIAEALVEQFDGGFPVEFSEICRSRYGEKWRERLADGLSLQPIYDRIHQRGGVHTSWDRRAFRDLALLDDEVAEPILAGIFQYAQGLRETHIFRSPLAGQYRLRLGNSRVVFTVNWVRSGIFMLRVLPAPTT